MGHLRVLNGQLFAVFRISWVLLLPLARLCRKRPYRTEIDDVYRRPNFPMGVGSLNLIQAPRVGVCHDRLHFERIADLPERVGDGID